MTNTTVTTRDPRLSMPDRQSRLLQVIRVLCCLSVFATAPSDALASCVQRPPVCKAYENYEAVFDGTVTSVERLNLESSFAGEPRVIANRLVTFKVHESWKGVSGDRVQLLLAGGYGVTISTSFEVSVGERYIIFAHREPSGYLSTSGCAHSQRHAPGATLEFLQSLRRAPAGAHVFGRVIRHREQEPRRAGAEPPRGRVTLKGSDGERVVDTADGRFEFRGLPTGSYDISVDVDRSLVGSTSGTFTLASMRDCQEVDFYLRINTHLTGRIVSASGEPVHDQRLELVDASRLDERPLPIIEASTDGAGYFTLIGVQPGRYLAGINLKDNPTDNDPYPRTLFAASDAEPVRIELGQLVDVGTLVRPSSLAKTHLSLEIVWANGRPVVDQDIVIEDATGGWSEGQDRQIDFATTDRSGRMEISGRAGRTYVATIRRRMADSSSVVTRSAPFPSDSTTTSLRVVLPLPGPLGR